MSVRLGLLENLLVLISGRPIERLLRRLALNARVPQHVLVPESLSIKADSLSTSSLNSVAEEPSSILVRDRKNILVPAR